MTQIPIINSPANGAANVMELELRLQLSAREDERGNNDYWSDEMEKEQSNGGREKESGFFGLLSVVCVCVCVEIASNSTKTKIGSRSDQIFMVSIWPLLAQRLGQ